MSNIKQKETEREFKPLDPHVPKFARKRFDILHLKESKEFYKELKEKYPELAVYTNAKIGNFIEVFNKRIAQEVINCRNGVMLPESLGIVIAGGCSIPREFAKKIVDHKTSKELGTRVYHENHHTDRKIFKIKYTNDFDHKNFINHHMWCFEADRPLTRSIAEEFKKPGGYLKYIVFTTKQHMGHLFRKQKIMTDKTEKVKNARLDQHDEFSFN